MDKVLRNMNHFRKVFCFVSCIVLLWGGQVFSNPIRVYADITGDLFHKGHVEFFKKAREYGDYLVVGVLADEVVETYKRAPILNLEERVSVIEACKYVDEVIIAPPLRLTEELIRAYDIDVVVHGDDFNEENYLDQYAVPVQMGIFKLVPYTEGISTTEIINRIEKRVLVNLSLKE